MYSLTFCVRFLLPERHQWKARIPGCRSNVENAPVALCCHSNATRAPIANPPNSAQLGGSLYHAPKLHQGSCSSVGVWPRTDTHTHKHR